MITRGGTMSSSTNALPRAGPALVLRQEQRPLAGLLQATALLTAGQLDLVAAAERHLAENPMLVRRPGLACPGVAATGAGQLPRMPRGVPGAGGEPSHAPLDALEVLARCEARGGGWPPSRSWSPPRRPWAARHRPADLAVRHGLPVSHVDEAVRAVRAAGPAGIAQRTVRDLLRAQAEDLAERRLAPAWLPQLVGDHLEAVAAGAVDEVAAALGLDPADVCAGFDLVRRRLRPWATPPPARDPGTRHSRTSSSSGRRTAGSTWRCRTRLVRAGRGRGPGAAAGRRRRGHLARRAPGRRTGVPGPARHARRRPDPRGAAHRAGAARDVRPGAGAPGRPVTQPGGGGARPAPLDGEQGGVREDGPGAAR